MGRKATRWVPVERDGKIHTVPQEFSVPRDWDAIALNAVCVAASLTVAGALTWSTVAIGGLLSSFVSAWAAYLVAGAFDMGWVICMVLEWRCRFDRDRATLPIACGWASLAVSVSLITLHGASGGGGSLAHGDIVWSRTGLVLGLCGGTVSVIAKGTATVVMRHMAVDMDPASEAWLTAERADVNSALAVTSARRQLARTQARVAAEAMALSLGQPGTWTAEQDRTPDTGTVPVLSQDSGTGQRDTGQDRTPVRRTAGQDNVSDLSGKQLPRAFVRGLLSADPELSNAELSSAVRAEYGPDMTQANVTKTIQRARGDLSRAV